MASFSLNGVNCYSETLHFTQMHYAPESFKMLNQGLTLLKFENFAATPILREIKFWPIQTIQKCHIWQL